MDQMDKTLCFQEGKELQPLWKLKPRRASVLAI